MGRGTTAGLPPNVRADLTGSLRAYWLDRARQHTQDSYAGVPISKFPEDLRVYEHLLWAAAPNVVIEIGGQYGGSALWFRDRLRTLLAYGRIDSGLVVSIDIDSSLARAAVAAADPSGGEMIEFVEADVTDPGLPDRVAALLPHDARCMVIEDSAHTYDTTAAALRGFARFVPDGGFFVVEDGCVDVDEMRIEPSWPRGVLPALEQWLGTPDGRSFAVRRNLEIYGISCHPRGFLQRVASGQPADEPAPAHTARPAQPGHVDGRLERELAAPPGWMYGWTLADGRRTPLLTPGLPAIHATRAQMCEDAVRAALAAAGSEATALDLACNEGWFGHRLVEWGAGSVLGVDIRAQNIRRAQLIRDHLGVSPERLRFLQADAFDLRPREVGTFDVVLLLGLTYHVEDPVGLLRVARALTRELCVIESQLTRTTQPTVHGWGGDAYLEAAGSFALRVEPDSDSNLLASAPGVVSLIPNRAALAEIARAAGFRRVEFAAASDAHERQYRTGDRAVLLAWV